MLDQSLEHEFSARTHASEQDQLATTIMECGECFHTVECAMITLCSECGGHLNEREVRPNQEDELDALHCHRVYGKTGETCAKYTNKFA